MKISTEARTAHGVKLCGIVIIILGSLAPVRGQKYEITPLVGGMFGGTVNLEQLGRPNFDAHLEDRLSYGIAGGFRFEADDCEGCNLIEFRWLRQNTHLRIKGDPLVLTPVAVFAFHPAVTLDQFLADFTREFTIKESRMIRPYLSASLGAARMSTPEASGTRFAFALGTGVKVFPKRNWGFRVQVEYMPIVMHAELQRVVCAVNCIVALSGGVMNQFHLSVGPTFRF